MRSQNNNKPKNSNKPKLLVIDDEPDNLDLLYRTFYREFRVLRAESGPEAIDLLDREGEVAVIISDQRMPLMSGTELLSQMVIKYPNTMRIILTGYTDVEDLVEAINSSKVFKYVTKPWDEDELRGVVKQAVETHKVLKAHTEELRRNLRKETVQNAIAHAINNAHDYRQILETIANTVGKNLEVSCCIVHPVQDGKVQDEYYVYAPDSACPSDQLAQIVPSTREIINVGDIANSENILDRQTQAIYETADVRSSLIMPLLFQKELIAVLSLYQCGDLRNWDQDDLDLMTTVCDQSALALSQARSYEQVRELAKRESLINTVTTAIRSSLDPQEIFAAITEQLGIVLDVDGCALSLWKEEDEFVQCVGLYAIDDDTVKNDRLVLVETNGKRELVEQNEPLSLPQSMVRIDGNPVLQELIKTHRPVAIDDIDKQATTNLHGLPLRVPTARSLLVVPLLSDGKIIGSISLRQSRSPRKWQASEVSLAQAVASQAAIAVQQAYLFQKTRQQTQQLVELDRQKTEFFQNISHEFRTPLTLTIGPLESSVSQKQALSLDQSVVALRNCRKLLRLVNQLLDLQRLDAGRMQSSFRPCDLISFASQTLDSFRPYCEKKNIRLLTMFDECPAIYLDLEKFDKVLYNLLSNAMKFTSSGGSITVSVLSRGDHCLLKVKDTGIGIREDQIPHLFERFRQAEGSISRNYEGSGLGLALVKELVEMHGGKVTVESVYGEGTTFSVWLQTGSAHLPPEQVISVPSDMESSRAYIELADVDVELEAAELDENEVKHEEGESAKEALVLIVDDNRDMRAYIASILTQEGYQVITANNGANGFEQVRKHRPNLIVTDLMMPKVSGLDMIHMIREAPEYAGTPVVLVTAKADEETRIEGVEKGADAYLSKPFSKRELLAEVHNLLALKDNERKVAELNRYLTESVLKRFLPPSMVEKAALGDLSLDLRPEPRMITVLFSDIVGFTEIANTLRSRRVAELLNQYLGAMTKAIFENGGTVDKFMGDGVLALFGAPEETSPNEQIRRAIATARQMKRSLMELNQVWSEQGIPPVKFRCGIHQGTAVVGMFGSAERSDYTAIGPTVNIASRIQSAAEPDCILVSAVVADYLEEDEIVKRGPMKLKGVDETVLTFFVKGAGLMPQGLQMNGLGNC
jgi:signal transduction histidine kinase/response regulator RpfG family c-di-GMP phosphodiesterase